MKTRRSFFLKLAAAAVALVLVVAPAIADELLGIITKIDVEGKKVTVVENETDKEVLITVTGDTEYVTKKASGKVDLEKLQKGLEKAKEKGAKGLSVKVTHDKNTASKIERVGKKAAN